jgi:hypothetical protein
MTGSRKAEFEHYIGKRIRIIDMEGEPQYSGKEGVVKFVDDMGQLHGSWGGCAVQPENDDSEIIKENDTEGTYEIIKEEK